MSAGKVFGNGTPSEVLSFSHMDIACVLSPILLGNIDSLSMLFWTHAIRCSTYSGAGIFVGLLKFSESCHRYSNLCLSQEMREVASNVPSHSSVAFISGHDCGEQNSVMDP